MCLGPLPPPITGTTPPDLLLSTVNSPLHQSAFRPVIREAPVVETTTVESSDSSQRKNDSSDDEVDIETTEDDLATASSAGVHSLHSASNSAASNHSGHSTSPQCWSPPRETVSLIKCFVNKIDIFLFFVYIYVLRLLTVKFAKIRFSFSIFCTFCHIEFKTILEHGR